MRIIVLNSHTPELFDLDDSLTRILCRIELSRFDIILTLYPTGADCLEVT